MVVGKVLKLCLYVLDLRFLVVEFVRQLAFNPHQEADVLIHDALPFSELVLHLFSLKGPFGDALICHCPFIVAPPSLLKHVVIL